MDEEIKAETEEFEDIEEDEEEIPDSQKDLLWALTRPIDEMSLEEQIEAVKRIRELRKVRISSTKRKSELDLALAQLTPEKASALLKQIEALELLKQQEGEKKE
jgi:hypothetical protein